MQAKTKMSHLDIIKKEADAGNVFAQELLRRKVEKLKPVKKVNEPVKEKPEVRSDEEIVRDITTPIGEFFEAANRIERKTENEC